MLLLSGCIEPYSPNLQEEAEDIYVISGEVTNHGGYQNVSISKSSAIDEPVEIPVSGSMVQIEDNSGNFFGMEEFSPGKYRVWIDEQYLIAGSSYRLHVNLSNGEAILSDFDTLHDCPELDSLYYERLDMISPVTGENVEALQFYGDFHGSETDSRLYRWSAVETWEHHSPWPIQYFWDGKMNTVFPWDYSLSVCWITETFPEVFTLSTRNMVSNDYIKLPLSYADNTTTRLYIGYSLLVTQHSMSEATYNYWEQLRINNDRKGGLYEKQPMPVSGNIRNLTDPSKKVLGNFEASGTSEKRIFIDGIKDMGIYYDSICAPYPLGRMGWREYNSSSYPVYLVMYNRIRLIVDPHCVDCRKYGGVLEKPEFWPY
jgi:hypothetical protein